ncbi:MAG: putative Ig domain-containing protein [Pirellulaceae bacterium]
MTTKVSDYAPVSLNNGTATAFRPSPTASAGMLGNAAPATSVVSSSPSTGSSEPAASTSSDGVETAAAAGPTSPSIISGQSSAEQETGNVAPPADLPSESGTLIVPGDFNADGSVDGGDFLTWQRNLGMDSNAKVVDGDADLDGDVDEYDRITWQSHLGMSPTEYLAAELAVPGDFNADNHVDAADYVIWRDHSGMQTGATQRVGDADGDHDVDGDDFLVWQRNFGQTANLAGLVVNPVVSRDDGDWGYNERGVWQTGSLTGGWQGDYRVQTPGDGSESAEWVTIFAPGDYEVFATWVADTSNASDARYHIFDGATELAVVTRDQTILPDDGDFNDRSWESLGVYHFTTGVPTIRLSNDASGLVVADGVLFAPYADCPFDVNLTGWRVTQNGGTTTDHGRAVSIGCGAVLDEGDSFRTSLETSFVIPLGATSLTFRYDSLHFDSTGSDFINDAFEVALVDETGASLVPTYSGDFTRDAFFNVTEDLPPQLGNGSALADGLVTVNLTSVAPGSYARLIFRLANDDQDTGTSVRIVDVTIPTGATDATEATASKFFVADSAADEIFRYGTTGNGLGAFSAVPMAQHLRGIASSDDGSEIWTIDGVTKRVHVQSADGTSLGTWQTTGLSSPQGITVHGNDLWVVDSMLGRVLMFTGTASRRSGEAAPTSTFALDVANTSPSDLVTDGTTIWVVDDEADSVFVYEMDGSLIGKWQLDSANGASSGITLDPTGVVDDMWTVDRNTKTVYRYANVRNRVDGSQAASETFLLTGVNTSPDGIADPLVTDPDDARTWLGASLGTFATLFYGDDSAESRQMVVDRQLLDDGLFDISTARPARLISGPDSFGPVGAQRHIDSTGLGNTVNIQVDLTPDETFNFIDNIAGSTKDFVGGTVFDLEVLAPRAAIFNNIDHGPLPQEAIESTAYLSRDRVNWVEAEPQRVWLEGWHENLGIIWDGFAYVVGTPDNTPFRYVSVIHGGPGALLSDGDNELNAVAAVGEDFQPVPLLTPTINVSNSAGREVAAGTAVLFSGVATAGQPTTPIVAVTVNGIGVDEVDVAGHFFSSATIQPGNNRFEFTATDAVGQDVSTTLTIAGTQNPKDAIDFSQFTDITGSFGGVYGRTSFVDGTNTLLVELATRNNGTFATNAPLLVGVTNIRSRYAGEAMTEVMDADGVTPDGVPYFDFTNHVINGQLRPGETSGSPVITFRNPSREQFDFDLVFYGKLNAAPLITSVPDVEAIVGGPYAYDVMAMDVDGDRLTFALESGPAHMAMTSEGKINLSPTVEDIGNHDILIKVTDGRGGLAEQRYTLTVIDVPPNRPPVITTTPTTSAEVQEIRFGPVEAIDLRSWSVGAVYSSGDPDPQWTPSEDGTSITQALNAKPSILLSPFDVSNETIEGIWQVGNTARDDDFIGFAFGYQDSGHFYLFDWKKVTQGFFGVTAEAGMSVKLISSDSPVLGAELWGTNGVNGRVTTLFHNSVPWDPNIPYRFVLESTTNGFNIVVSRGAQILDTFTIDDPVYRGGRFGFYNFSQPQVTYSGFARQSFAEPTYRYDVGAFDPDGDTLTYSLPVKPTGMMIDSQTGAINWAPTLDQQGNHPVVVRASDGNGGIVDQEFIVCVHGDPSNHAPAIITEPTTIHQLDGTEYRYQVHALDPDNDPITYRLGNGAPDGMTLDAESGELVWSPKSTDIGTHPISVSISDGRGGSDEQSFSLEIVEIGTGVIRGRKFEDVGGSQTTGVLNLPIASISAQTAAGQSAFVLENGLLPSDRLRAQISGTVEFNAGDFANYSADWNAAGVIVRSRGNRLSVGGSDPEYIDIGWLRLAIGNDEIGYFPLLEPNSENGLGGDTPPETLSLDRTARDIFGEEFEGLPAGTGLFFRIFDDPVVDNTGSFEIGLLPDSPAPGLQGWTIYIDENNNSRLDSHERAVTTDANGDYEFDGLLPGQYVIREQPQSGWLQTFPGTTSELENAYVVEVVESSVSGDVNFGNARSELSNRPPSILNVPSEVFYVGETNRFDFAYLKPDSDVVRFTTPVAPIGLTIHPTLGSLVWAPSEDQVGEHAVLVSLSDGKGGQDSVSFTLTVADRNLPPVITSLPIARARSGESYVSPLHAQDPDGNPVVFRLETAPVGMEIRQTDVIGVDGTVIDRRFALAWLPVNTAVGSEIPVTLVASDGLGGESQQSFVVTIVDASHGNVSPEITSSPLTRILLGQTYQYAILAHDADGDGLSYEVLDGPAGLTISNTGIVSWTGQTIGTYHISLAVRDDHAGMATQAYDLRVVAQDFNTSPTITSKPTSHTTLGQEYAYRPVALDAEGDELRWRLEEAPKGMSIDSISGEIRWLPDELQLGSQPVTVVVTDTRLASARQQFAIDVNCSNLPPAIVSVPPTVAVEGDAYFYATRVDDPEGDPLTWTLAQSPPGMSINNRGIVTWRPHIDDIGPHHVTIEVTDGPNTARQSYDVVVNAADSETANQPPVIQSIPVFVSDTNRPYQYAVLAFDPEGGPVTFELSGDVPKGMAIGLDGVITWEPTDVDFGERVITVNVTDAQGALATQSYVLETRANHSPMITSSPASFVTAGSLYRYSLAVVDGDNDPIIFSLLDGPEGMSLDAFGQLRWNVPASETDPVNVSVLVTDGRGGSDSQTWTVTPVPDTEVPRVSISVVTAVLTEIANVVRINPGTEYSVWVQASDNVGVVALNLSADGLPVALNRGGVATFSADTISEIRLVATATDAAGNIGTATTMIKVVDPADSNRPVFTDPTLPPHPGFDPNDNGIPNVVITSPELGASVRGVVPIIGTIDDPEDNLWYYRVYYSRADRVSITNIDLDDPDWVMFHEGVEEVHNGEIASFDPTLLTIDAYAVIVAAYDVNGQGYAYPTTFFVDSNPQVGNFRLEFNDLTIPLAGIPITITRVYDTLSSDDEGDFGYGWTLGVQDAQIFEAVALGVGGGLNYTTDKFIPDRTKVFLTNPDGKRIGFTYREEIVSQSFFGAELRAYFDPDPGVYDVLTIENATTLRGGAFGQLVSGLNPDRYFLTRPDGTVYVYDQFTGLESITDRNGNTVTFTEDGITHSSGESIRFHRDGRGRIREIVDPSGSVLTYSYDAVGDLRTFTNQEGLTTSFSYNEMPEHFLDEVIDANGNRALKAVYEQNPDTRQWEFKGVFDAMDNRADERDFDLRSHTGVIRDANGNLTTLQFDDRGNVLVETDAAGNETIREYSDPRNPDKETRIIDRRGYVTVNEYDGRGNRLKSIETGHKDSPFAEPLVTSYTYNANNDVTSVTDALNHTTVFRYSGPNLVEIVNAAGNSATFSYYPNGNVQTFTDFNGNTTSFSDYQNGQPRRIIFADGTQQRFEHNQFGQTTYEAYVEADGTVVQEKRSFFDSAGRLIEEITGSDEDNSKLVRKLFYDGNLLDWEIIVHPDSLDGSGNLLESPATPVAERKSSITDYVYDVAGRLISQIDAEGGVVDFRYDAQGNRIALRDPAGNITTWLYDFLDRPIEERAPLFWDAIRQQPQYASLSADAFLDQIAPATSSAGANPLYDDPSGASCGAKTGAAHVRLTCYDAEGNESFTLDRNGRRREYEYDHAANLVREQWFDDLGTLIRTTAYDYDAAGNMLTSHDPDSTYVFTYDVLNQLKSVDNEGSPGIPHVILTYGYDGHGNVISVTDNFGVSVESVYNSRNLLDKRTWRDTLVPTGETSDIEPLHFAFHYNAAGRPEQVLRYRGTDDTNLVGKVVRDYDRTGRSTDITFTNAVDQALADYGFGYNALGSMDHDTRAGIEATYVHDLTGQLLSATRTNGNDEFFSYDLNGNRTLPGYVTGPGNRLKSDGVYAYEYDGEGNRIARTEIASGEITHYEYDHRNLLVRVSEQGPGGNEVEIAAYTYDALNRRIMIKTAEDTTVTVHDRDQAWVDFNDAGEVEARYLYDDEIDMLLAIAEAEQQPIFVNVDLLGSVVGYISVDGALAATVAYDVFGGLTHGEPVGRFGYAGRERDRSTELYYFRARYYQPSVARYLVRDTIAFLGNDANLYRYVGNAPLVGSDPSGNITAKEVAIIYNTIVTAVILVVRATTPPVPCPPKEAGISYLNFWVPDVGIILANAGLTFLEFHPGAVSGYRHPTGAQCTYDGLGRLISSGKGAGTADLFPPFTLPLFALHLLAEVIPEWLD